MRSTSRLSWEQCKAERKLYSVADQTEVAEEQQKVLCIGLTIGIDVRGTGGSNTKHTTAIIIHGDLIEVGRFLVGAARSIQQVANAISVLIEEAVSPAFAQGVHHAIAEVYEVADAISIAVCTPVAVGRWPEQGSVRERISVYQKQAV